MRKLGIPLAIGLMFVVLVSLTAGFRHNLASVALVRWSAAGRTRQTELPAVLRDPANPRAAGIIQLWLGHSEQAVRLLEDAAQARPGDMWARYYLGHALRQDGRQEEAIAHWRVLDAAGVAWAFVNLASTAQENVPSRIEYARLALEIDPGLGAAYYQLGQAYSTQGRWDEAAEMFGAAISQAEDRRTTAGAYRALGRLLVAQGDSLAAVSAFEQAVALLPEEESYYARLELADQYQGAERYQDALTLLETARKLDPTNDRAWVRIGDIRQSQERFDLAEAAYLEAISADQTSGRGPYAYGRFLLALGRQDEAVAYLELAASRAYGVPQVWVLLGETYRDLEQIDQAIEAYTHSVQTTEGRDNLQSWIALAELYESGSRPAEAEMAWKRVLQISPGYPAALRHLEETE
jgi:tetratricopeptide (TPR) repeat protein